MIQLILLSAIIFFNFFKFFFEFYKFFLFCRIFFCLIEFFLFNWIFFLLINYFFEFDDNFFYFYVDGWFFIEQVDVGMINFYRTSRCGRISLIDQVDVQLLEHLFLWGESIFIFMKARGAEIWNLEAWTESWERTAEFYIKAGFGKSLRSRYEAILFDVS